MRSPVAVVGSQRTDRLSRSEQPDRIFRHNVTSSSSSNSHRTSTNNAFSVEIMRQNLNLIVSSHFSASTRRWWTKKIQKCGSFDWHGWLNCEPHSPVDCFVSDLSHISSKRCVSLGSRMVCVWLSSINRGHQIHSFHRGQWRPLFEWIHALNFIWIWEKQKQK